MKSEIFAIFMIMLFLGTFFVLPSDAITLENNRIVINNYISDNNPPTIDSVEYLSSGRTISGFKVTFIVKASDPDGDYIWMRYRKSEDDYWWNNPDILPSPAIFKIDWNVKRGSYTAHFKVCDDLIFSQDIAKTFNVPKPRFRTNEYIFSLKEMFKLFLFVRIF